MSIKRNRVARESSDTITISYCRLLELCEEINKGSICPDEDLRRLIVSGVDCMQFEEIKYTMATGGRTSPYYEYLLKTADELIELIDSELEEGNGI